MTVSNCCGAGIKGTDICSECFEHCKLIEECEACGGYHEDERLDD